MKLRFAILLAAALMLSGKPVMADTFSISAGAFAVQSEYKGSDARVLPTPIIDYEGTRFYLKNTEAGVFLWNDGMQKVSLGVNLLPQYFRSSKSDDYAMKQLDNRNITVLATLRYNLTTDFGSLNLSASGDITGTTDGFMASASYAYPIHWGGLSVVPLAGVMFSSSDFNDYYYGISHSEARRSGFNYYSPDSSITPFVGVKAIYAFTDHWSVFASWNMTFLDDEIKDSPMVDRDTQHIFGGGITYTF
ncbi:MipA/OmpV family protein [uncultured Mailhella sp.]|uniref:MipA/OmpV family protein n=1 Tax=uncultured Mailhella sp. TaxID=1981031 RepID=UPI00320AAF3B